MDTETTAKQKRNTHVLAIFQHLLAAATFFFLLYDMQ